MTERFSPYFQFLQKEVPPLFKSKKYWFFIIVLLAIYIIALSQSPSVYTMQKDLAAWLLVSTIVFSSLLAIVLMFKLVLIEPDISKTPRPFLAKLFLLKIVIVSLAAFSGAISIWILKLNWITGLATILPVLISSAFTVISSATVGVLLPNTSTNWKKTLKSPGVLIPVILNSLVIVVFSVVSYYFFKAIVVACFYTSDSWAFYWQFWVVATVYLAIIGSILCLFAVKKLTRSLTNLE